MTSYTVEIARTGIVDKHTHYEAHPFIGQQRVTVIIRGDIATGFREKYGIPLAQAERLQLTVNLGRNDQRVGECQDLFRPASHLMGAVNSLDDIVYAKK